MLIYAIVIIISMFACEFAFASRKAMGITCVKDFIITYNYRIVPYIVIPVIMVLLIVYFRKMYDDNRMIRYVNIRKFYCVVIGKGVGRIVMYVIVMSLVVLAAGLISTHGVMDNWQMAKAMAKRVYGGYLTYTGVVTIFAGVAITLIIRMIINMELLMIIYRYAHSWIVGYFICVVMNLYVLIEQSNTRILNGFITYRVYQNGWGYASLLPMMAVVMVLLIVVLLMGKSDSLKRNR